MKKDRIFIDVDNTIFNTDKRMLDYLNNELSLDYKMDGIKNYKVYSTLFDVSDEVVRDAFCSERFYEKSYLFKDAIHQITLMLEFAEVVFYTNGTRINNARKLMMLDKYFPDIEVIADSFPVTDGKQVSKIKKNVKTRGTIFIDDSKTVLDSTEASHRILFRGNYITSDQMLYCGSSGRYLVTEWENMAEFVKKIIDNRG